MEWKKIRFMQDRVGEDFQAIILSCTKYGFFVELDELFIEGLVPLLLAQPTTATPSATPTARSSACAPARSSRSVSAVHVLLDRIDKQEKRLQFALVPDSDAATSVPSLRKRRVREPEIKHSSAKRSGKPAKKVRNKKAKGKRR